MIKRRAVLLLATVGAISLIAQSPQLTREYIRLGGRVIATESPVGSLAVTIEPNIPLENNIPFIGSADTLAFTATPTPAHPGPITWTASAGTISSSGVFQWGASAIGAPTQVQITASIANGPTSVPFTLTVKPVLSPASVTLTSAAVSPAAIQVTKRGLWTAVSNNPDWLAIESPVGSFSGNGSVGYRAGANEAGSPRQGTLTIAGTTFTVVQSSSSIWPLDVSVGGAGGSGSQSVAVSSPSWQIASRPSWLTTVPPVGQIQTGPGTISFQADVNPTSSPRTGDIMIGSTAVHVTQYGGISLSSSSQAGVPAEGGSYSVEVTAPANSPWTVGAVPSGIVIDGGASGGGGTVTTLAYRVLANSGAARNLSFSIGGKTFSVAQLGGAGNLTITMSPGQNYLFAGQQIALTALVNGSAQSANWVHLTGPGQLSSTSGSTVIYTAPSPITSSASVSIQASVGSAQRQAIIGLYPSSDVTLSTLQSGWASETFELSLSPPYYASDNGAKWNPLDVLVTANSGGSFPSGVQSCYLKWNLGSPPLARVELMDDSGLALSSALILNQSGSSGSIRNSQCILDGANSGFRLNGQTMVIKFRLLFNPQWSGPKKIYARAMNSSNVTTFPAREIGMRTVPEPLPPLIGLVSPPSSIVGLHTFEGWAVDNGSGVDSSISSVEVFVGGVKVGNAVLNSPPPQGGVAVCTSNPLLANCPNSGFRLEWNSQSIPNGTYEVTAIATDTNSPAQTAVSMQTITVSNTPQVAAPTFSPNGGSFQGSTTVSMGTATPEATIYYTTDGLTPTLASSLYTAPLSINNTLQLKAFARKDQMADSSVSSVSFTITPQSGWYETGGLWNYRRPLTIDHNKVAGGQALTNFPVLVSLVHDDFRTISAGGKLSSSIGNDILFTASDGFTKLAHEVEKWDGSTGQLTAWVKIPTLSASVDTSLYLYYGNSSATDQQNKTGVWDANYVGVWHMAENSGTALNDSTSYANQATKLSSSEPNPNAGKVAAGQAFDGSNDRVQLSSDAEFNTTSLTIQMWANVTLNASTLYQRLFDTPPSFTKHPILTYGRYGDTLLGWSVGGSEYESPSGSFLFNQWNHIAVVHDGTNSTMYINGQSVSKVPTYAGFVQENSGVITIGSRQNQTRTTNGTLDEVRYSNVARSAGWITTEYNNQNSPGTFLSLGGEQIGGTTVITPTINPPGATYSQSQNVTLSTPTTGATIYYTTNGNPPSPGAAGTTAYGGTPVSISASTTLKVMARKAGLTDSGVVTEFYFIQPKAAAPVISPAGGTFNSPQTVTISTSTPGAAIHYRTDGLPAGSDSPLYTGPFSFSQTGTVTARSFKVDMLPSDMTSAGFTFSPGDWYTTGGTWNHRRQVTIDHTKVAGGQTLSNFPVLISITNASLKALSQGGEVATGNDILFTGGDGLTKLSHEVEKWDGTTGQLVAWVKIPTLSASADTSLFLYYGNTTASDQQNKTAVWDTTYKGVWHLPDGSALNTADTVTGATATVYGVTAVGAQISGGANINGGTNRLDYGSSTLASVDLSDKTVSAWIYPTSLGSLVTLVDKEYDSLNGNWGGWGLWLSSTGKLWWWAHAGLDLANDDGTSVATNAWTYVTVTWNASSKTASFYVNGNPSGSSLTNTSIAPRSSSSQPFQLGARRSGNGNFPGRLDEVRVSNVIRSAGWILTEHRNQSSPATFLTLGAQQ